MNDDRRAAGAARTADTPDQAEKSETADTPGTAQADALEARVIALTRELRCLVCRNESVAESRAPLAVDLRERVRRMLAQGESPDAIRRALVERYGDRIDYRPPRDARTALLWGGPPLLVAASAAVVAAVVRRRSRLARD